MALVLGVAVGDVIDIADQWIAIISVDTQKTATVIGKDGDKYTISSIYETEVMPSVWVQLGPEPARSRLRLQFEAPKSIAITRRPPRPS